MYTEKELKSLVRADLVKILEAEKVEFDPNLPNAGLRELILGITKDEQPADAVESTEETTQDSNIEEDSKKESTKDSVSRVSYIINQRRLKTTKNIKSDIKSAIANRKQKAGMDSGKSISQIILERKLKHI